MLQLANTLIEQRSVAIVQGQSSLLIFYPSNLILMEGVFLERATAIEPHCHICIEVRTPGSNFPPSISASESTCLPRNLERLFYRNHGWKAEEFFVWSSQIKVKKNVYIMAHPQTHKSETEMLARYFRELGADVWLPETKGSWNDFMNLSIGKGGVIIVGGFDHMYCILVSRISHSSTPIFDNMKECLTCAVFSYAKSTFSNLALG